MSPNPGALGALVGCEFAVSGPGQLQEGCIRFLLTRRRGGEEGVRNVDYRL